MFLLVVGIPADAFFTGGILLGPSGISMVWSLIMESFMRVAVAIAFSSAVLQFSRDHHLAWGLLALFGLLLLVLSAQLALI